MKKIQDDVDAMKIRNCKLFQKHRGLEVNYELDNASLSLYEACCGQPLNVILAKSMMFRMTVNRSGSLEEIGSKNKAVTDVDFWECVKKECRQRDSTSSSSIDGHINVSGDC